jgi:hypothetical protein
MYTSNNGGTGEAVFSSATMRQSWNGLEVSSDWKPVSSARKQINQALKLAAEITISWCQRSEYEVDLRWSLRCNDVSLEAEERPLLKAATKQRDWER